MAPTASRGGNYVAEAGYGLWNPVVLLLDVTVLRLDDLAIAAAIVKATYMVILAVGVNLLAREYDATPWPAVLAGLSVPLGGFTLSMDAATWRPNLVSFAFMPDVWLTARRLGRHAGGPAALVVAGALCVSAGNPYSNVIVGPIDAPSPMVTPSASQSAARLGVRSGSTARGWRSFVSTTAGPTNTPRPSRAGSCSWAAFAIEREPHDG